ncbi:MAG: hypothetical protein AB7P02_05570 [Alphaproteobacteria bacterium]
MDVLRESADAIQSMRSRIARVIGDDELFLRRISVDDGRDDELVAAGTRLQTAAYCAIGRALMIEQGPLTADPTFVSLERVEPVTELAFVPISGVP